MTRQAKGPGGESEALQSVIAATSPILPDTAVKSIAHAAELPAFVVLMNTRNDRVRRYVYLSLHSAAAAVERARDRGQDAELVLCELRPVVGGVSHD